MINRFVLSLLFISGLASAQATRGIFFVAPGGVTGGGSTLRTYSVGGGIERLLVHGIGAGAELEGVIPGAGRASDSVGIFSLNGSYHIWQDRRLDPFATMGYSLLFRTSTANMFNYGGGVNYWFKDNLGVQVAIRDHVSGNSGGPAVHYWGIRIGLTVR